MMYRDDYIKQIHLSQNKFSIEFKQNNYYIESNNIPTTRLFREFSQNDKNKNMIEYLLSRDYFIYQYNKPISDFDFLSYDYSNKIIMYYQLKRRNNDEESIKFDFKKSRGIIKRISRFIQKKN